VPSPNNIAPGRAYFASTMDPVKDILYVYVSAAHAYALSLRREATHSALCSGSRSSCLPVGVAVPVYVCACREA